MAAIAVVAAEPKPQTVPAAPVGSTVPAGAVATSPKKILPTEIYSYRTDGVKLRVATGSSGVTHLLKALAEAYIRYCVEVKKEETFQIGWYATNTHTSIEYLAANDVDVAITYHDFVEQVALDMGIIDRVAYGWRDRWMLVGPTSNPAGLKDDLKQSVYRLFMDLYIKMETTKGSKTPVQFLSRWDKSASNTKEQEIWSFLGHLPWVPGEASWYKKTHSNSFEAMRLAAKEGYYTLTSYGVWSALSHDVGNKLKVFALGGEVDTDPLFNPAHLCVGAKAVYKARATDFVNWIISQDGGQKIIKSFKQNDVTPYTGAPEGADPLDRVRKATKARDALGIQILPPTAKPKDDTTKPTSDDKKVDTKTDSKVGSETKVTVNGGEVKPVTSDANGVNGDHVIGCGKLPPATVPEHVPYEGTVWAAVPTPNESDTCWVFHDGNYARYNIKADTMPYGVLTIRDKWPGLYQNGFDAVDAAVPVTQNDTYAYFFYGRRCILINLLTGAVKDGEKPFYWADKWPIMASSGWTRIDTAWPMFEHPVQQGSTFFFRGKESLSVNLATNVVSRGPFNFEQWVLFKTPGFIRPKYNVVISGKEWKTIYILSGTEYIGFTEPEEKPWGPTPIKKHWGGLVKAGWV